MPYRKRYSYRRRSRKKMSAMAVAKKALRQNRPRMKYALSNFVLTNMTEIWTTALVNGIATGDTESLRDGDKIKIHALEIRFRIRADAAASNSAAVRYVVFYDRQTNGANPVPTVLFESNAQTTMTNIASTQRFRILLDRSMRLENFTGNATVGQHFTRTHFLRWKAPLHTQYALTINTIAAINTGGLFFAWIGDRTAEYPQIEANFKLHFTSS